MPTRILTHIPSVNTCETCHTSNAWTPTTFDHANAPSILLIVGGVPISVGGNFYGGVAVAGAEPEIDEKYALSGVEAIKNVNVRFL